MHTMTLRELLQVLGGRKKRVIGIALFVMAVTLAVTLLMPAVYLGEVSVAVDAPGIDPATGLVVPPPVDTDYRATEVDVISSHSVAVKVVDKLRLDQIPGLVQQFNERLDWWRFWETDHAATLRDFIADRLLAKLDVVPARDSNVIVIDYYGRQPETAVRIANAFADAYIETSLELKVNPASRQSALFQGQVDGLRKALEEAQQRLSDYQRKNGIAGADDRLDVESVRLGEMSTQLADTQAQASDAESRLRQLAQADKRGEIEQLPDLIGNGALVAMKNDLMVAEGNLASVAQRYDRNHPQYLSAQAQVQELRKRLAAELETATGSLRQGAEIARHRTADLQQAVDQEKQHILTLKRQRDDQDVLIRDVQNAQKTYDDAKQRSGAVGIGSHLEQSRIAVLSPATVQLEPARPRPVLYMAAAAVLGVLLGIGAALIAELLDRRVRSRNHVAEVGLLVLGELRRLAIGVG
jgi:succinoglycan biosynthesis transport protein ExoP